MMNEYTPKFVSPPGATLYDILEEATISVIDFAEDMGWPVQKVNDIIRGKHTITDEDALELENALQVPALFWIEREKRYRESLDR
jgi:plasmid maintenance system antidote protein VapI